VQALDLRAPARHLAKAAGVIQHSLGGELFESGVAFELAFPRQAFSFSSSHLSLLQVHSGASAGCLRSPILLVSNRLFG
jgi:hypothetical protein